MGRIKTERTTPICLRLLDNGIGVEKGQDITSEAKQQKECQKQQDKRDYLLPAPGFWLRVK